MQQEEMLGWRKKLMLKQTSIIIRGKPNLEKISKRIVSSINIFINICYGLTIVQLFTHFCNLDILCACMCVVVIGKRSFSFFQFFVFELEYIAIQYAMNRKFMEGKILSIWGKFNYFYNLDNFVIYCNTLYFGTLCNSYKALEFRFFIWQL